MLLRVVFLFFAVLCVAQVSLIGRGSLFSSRFRNLQNIICFYTIQVLLAAPAAVPCFEGGGKHKKYEKKYYKLFKKFISSAVVTPGKPGTSAASASASTG